MSDWWLFSLGLSIQNIKWCVRNKLTTGLAWTKLCGNSWSDSHHDCRSWLRHSWATHLWSKAVIYGELNIFLYIHIILLFKITPGFRFNMNTDFPRKGIFIIKTMVSLVGVVIIPLIPILVTDHRAPFQYEDRLSRYGISHVIDKTVARPSYLFNTGIPISVRQHFIMRRPRDS